MDMDQFVNASEAARRLGTSPQKLSDWCRRGRVPGAVKFANMWIMPVDSLEKIDVPKMGRPVKERVEEK